MDGTPNKDVPVERKLPCKLTEDELLARGDAMAQAELEIEELRARRKALNTEIRDQVDLRARLAHVIEAGVEDRAVVCKWIDNFAANQSLLIRQDTGAEVESRTLTASELQTEFDLASGEVAQDIVDDIVESVDDTAARAKQKQKRRPKPKPASSKKKTSPRKR
jgi:hypothetical protein